jgi:hypothetical protein
MDRVLQSNQFTSRQIRQVDYCLLFLLVHTFSGLATALGTHIAISLFSGQPSLLSSQSTEHQIRQERPNTTAAWAVWRKACSLWCDTKSGKLHQPLGPGYYQASLFAEHSHFIGTLRPEVSWSALSKATLFNSHSPGARGVCDSIETQLSTH